jgi:2-desacetyl-2-hydroxyethyl bacteriochlorophyllide A dehydrogenase
VLVRIRRVGVCGTDFHIFQGKHPFLQYPLVMGHELSGTVVSAPHDSGLQAGQNVYVVPYLCCGICRACRKGITNACRHIRVLGVHVDGGMAEFVCVRASNVVPLGETSLDDGAMIEFLAIGAHGVKRGGVASSDRVLVVGSGPIGMSAIVFAKARGAHVTVMDQREDRLTFARGMLGADAILGAGADAESEASEATSGDFFDVVIDCTGNEAAMQRGLGFVGHGGRFVLVSVISGNITFSDPELHKRETTILASRNAQPDDFAAVVREMEAGNIPTNALRTHSGRLDRGPELFREWLRPDTGVIKAVLEL